MKRFATFLLVLISVRRILLAYIDPNTGGMIFQFLAVLFGLLSGLLLFFSGRIKAFVARFRRSVREEEEDLADPASDPNSSLKPEPDNEIF